MASSCSGTNQPETRVTVNSLPSMKRGRPSLIGETADEYFKKNIIAMRERGAPIGTSVVVGIGHGILLRTDKYILEEFRETIKINKEWAKTVLRRMGLTK